MRLAPLVIPAALLLAPLLGHAQTTSPAPGAAPSSGGPNLPYTTAPNPGAASSTPSYSAPSYSAPPASGPTAASPGMAPPNGAASSGMNGSGMNTAGMPAQPGHPRGMTREEFIQQAVRFANRRFDMMDTNHDGILTMQERRAWRMAHGGGGQGGPGGPGNVTVREAPDGSQ